MSRRVIVVSMILAIIGLAVFFISLLSPSSSVGPIPYTKKAFTAEYENKESDGKIRRWQASSNGQGRLRSDDYTDGSVSLCDFNEGKSYQFNPRTKSGTSLGIKGSNFEYDEEWLKSNQKSLQAKSIGNKTINGYECRGWSIPSDSGPREYWFGKDLGCLVYGAYPPVWESRLVSYKVQPLTSEMFEIPEYCKK